MPRKKTKGFTERESEIMSILWERGSASVEEIRERLTGAPSASTVRTLLAIMADRGLVADDGKGYAKRYHARIDRAEAQGPALRRMIDTLFAGSAEALVLRLMDEGEVDLDQLQRLQARLRGGEAKSKM
jgi:predicted transcriptional regulator